MFEKLIKKIAKLLDKNKIPYMVIGGQAVLLYGVPRLTRDIDITLGLDTESFLLIKNICKRLGLRLLPKNPEKFAKDTNVLPVEDNNLKVRIDFIFSFTPYERMAIKRARKVSMAGYGIKFASCEDVIIHKMFAGRAIDEEDVKNILIKNKKSVNLKYVKKWLSEFSKIGGQKELSKRFNSLFKEI